ncbi:type I polyketide synthase [Actinokineospora sp. 24-640]
MSELSGLEIAVVGLAGRFPGASTVDEFWRAALDGTVGLRRFTDEEMTAAGVPDALRADPRHVPVGGALDGVAHFDARFFGYSPRDAAVLDPQHRLFLECAWHALEHAGHLGGGGVTGVYASASFNTYLLRNLLDNPAVPGGLSAMDLILANDKDTLAGRVAYHLDLTGPAITVQTACSSSLVAVHLACQALLSGDCDTAVAGGVSVRPPLHEGYLHTEGGILSPDGRCLPFDAAAGGAVAGNGLAAVVLRPLAAALADGDTVHAVVKGTAVNNDGADKVGFTAPSVAGQARVIRAAHEVSGVDSATIGYVEAHGTGTAMGDPIEVAALTRAFTTPPAACGLGSVKAQIGHLDAAAGIAGFVKAALAVRDGVIPPSPYFETANPETGIDAGPFFLPTEPAGWPVDGPRRAGVSGFAMGGTNAHAVLEQPPTPVPSGQARPRQLLVLSAATADALAESRTRLATALRAPDAPDLADAAHTLRVGRRTTLPHRMALVCADRAEAAALLDGTDGPVWTNEQREHRRGVVLLFPGQGSQYPGMARDLYAAEAVFRAALDECAELLRPHLDVDLIALLHGEHTDRLDRTRYTQPALFAVQHSLARLWAHWGVTPTAMLGHSVGEYTAACLAGVLSLPDALALVAARGALMDALPGGSMLAVPLGADDLELDGEVCLAAGNAPDMSTVAGPGAAIERFAARLAEAGVAAKPLRTSHAFHSAMIEPMLPEFAERVAGVTLSAPRIPFVSNVTGHWITAGQATDPGYWAGQARQAVRFSDGLRTLLADGPALLLETGPGTTLATLARRHRLAEGGHAVFSSLRHPREDRHDLDTVLAAAGRLWAAGARVDLTALTADERRHRVPLPGYPFARDRHWVDMPGAAPVEQPTRAPAVVVAAAAPDDELAVVTGIWRELLGVDRIAPGDDFFELGGHSLLATQILARIGDALGVTLPAGAIFTASTPARLAELARTTRPTETADPAESAEIARLLAEIRDMSPETLRAELDRAHAQETPQP